MKTCSKQQELEILGLLHSLQIFEIVIFSLFNIINFIGMTKRPYRIKCLNFEGDVKIYKWSNDVANKCSAESAFVTSLEVVSN